MQRERLMIARPAIVTLAGILAIGWGLAVIAPPHWQSCEMILLAACIALIWECLRTTAHSRVASRRSATLSPGSIAWFNTAAADLRDPGLRTFRPWDVEQAAARLRPSGKLVLHPAVSTRQSMEQMSEEMLERAFRQNPKKHSPCTSRGPLHY